VFQLVSGHNKFFGFQQIVAFLKISEFHQFSVFFKIPTSPHFSIYEKLPVFLQGPVFTSSLFHQIAVFIHFQICV
jgi:hypothetical protein